MMLLVDHMFVGFPCHACLAMVQVPPRATDAVAGPTSCATIGPPESFAWTWGKPRPGKRREKITLKHGNVSCLHESGSKNNVFKTI